MKLTRILFLTTLFFTFLAQKPLAKTVLDLKEITDSVFIPNTIAAVHSMKDGAHYTQLSSDKTQVVKYEYKTGLAVEVLFDAAKARECNFKTIDDYQLSPDETTLLLQTETKPIYRHSFTANHYLFTIRRNLVEPLTDHGQEQVPLFSPDGTMVAFVYKSNMHLVKILFDRSESQITHHGIKDVVINGIPDWVYEEEFGFTRAFTWSPDSKIVAYIKFKEETEKPYTIQLFGKYSAKEEQFPYYPTQFEYKYPKAGSENATTSIHTFDIESKVIKTMELPKNGSAYYTPRIQFTSDPTKLAITTLNRAQNQKDIYFANPRSGVCILILREESPYYINSSNLDQLLFYPDHFGVLSEKDGFNHLYWYTIGGNLVKQITKGEFEVSQFKGWDAQNNTFYYESNEEGTELKTLYKIDLKGKKMKLSSKKGVNSALFSNNFQYYINSYSNTNTPTEEAVFNNEGKQIVILEANQALKNRLATLQLAQKEFFSFKASHGEVLKGWMMKPANFNASTKYPVILYQYSGPGSQQVIDKYSVTWEHYMASLGFVIVCVDGRGTGGRGAEFAKCTYRQIGVKEAEDQIETAKYMQKQPFVNPSKIGIWGWSYGGYITLMSMSEGSALFKAGVAVAAVTDFRFYDTIWTERYQGTPQDNFDGYSASSAFTRAPKLAGSLLLIHGLADDNVHFQNMATYSEHLVDLNKQFEMQVYTNKNHSIEGGNTRYHLYTKMMNFFKRELQ